MNSDTMRLSPRFRDALSYAAELHAAQRRKASGEPYIAHLLAVAALVLEHGGNEDEAIAALLHDAVEDQGGVATQDEIARRFGPTVVALVDGCTDTSQCPKPPWQARKEAYLARIADAPAALRLIVAADKLHNVQSLLREFRRHGDTMWQLFNGGRDGTLWYYRSLVDALRKQSNDEIVVELATAVAELEAACGKDSCRTAD